MLDRKLTNDVEPVMKSAIGRTQSYFNGEYGIKATEARSEGGDPDSLTLLDMTAIVRMGGGVNLLIAFSFQDALVDTLFKRMTADFDIAPDEVEMYREAAAGEAVNTILGHSTIDLQKTNGPAISMTPPVTLDRVKTIRRMKNAMFYTRSLDTEFGRMNISLVGPQELFDTHLDYVK